MMVERVVKRFVWAGDAFKAPDFAAGRERDMQPVLTVAVEGDVVAEVKVEDLPHFGDGGDWDDFARVVRECDEVVNRIRVEAKLLADA